MRVATLIPSAGRPDILVRTFRTCPMLNSLDTYVGIEAHEVDDYNRAGMYRFDLVNLVEVTNPERNAGTARQQLKVAAMAEASYDAYLLGDDDVVITTQANEALLQAYKEYTEEVGPCAIGAMHQTYKHFDAAAIKCASQTRSGLRTYEKCSWMWWVVPHTLYKVYAYPDDVGYMDDYHVTMWLITHGLLEWRVCVDAPFSSLGKDGTVHGGFGSASRRVANVGKSITRIATDFPDWMTTDMVAFKRPFRRMINGARQLHGE